MTQGSNRNERRKDVEKIKIKTGNSIKTVIRTNLKGSSVRQI
jgi:hypothetical protein